VRRLARWKIALADLVEVDGSGANEWPRRSP
jgi:hypothetical protein